MIAAQANEEEPARGHIAINRCIRTGQSGVGTIGRVSSRAEESETKSCCSRVVRSRDESEIHLLVGLLLV